LKIVVERSIRDRLETFLEYLKNRAQSNEHEANRDLIADFVDKFLVYEIKRVANDDDTTEEEIEIPSSALIDPLFETRDKVIDGFDSILRKMGATDHDFSQYRESGRTQTKAPPSTENQSSTDSSTSTERKPRNGNGHKSEKIRDLSDDERDILKSQFLSANGCFGYRECTQKLKPLMGLDIAIFQVTGFISYLHRAVASGEILLGDLAGYLQFLRDKYPDLAKQYSSEKYTKIRNRRDQQQTGTQQQSYRPVFNNMRRHA